MVAERFAVPTRTVDRWLVDPRLEFPRPLIIHTRRYFDLAEIEGWERRRQAAGKAA
jgi:hypothetical protein